jgi:hypothetical protein
MEKVQGWCTSNDMVINAMKSKSMIMGSSRKIQYLESNFYIFYDDVLLNDVKYEKVPGITIAARFCNLHSFSRFKFVVSPHTVQQ